MSADPTILPEAATWHYIVAAILLLLMGAIGHVTRAVLNIYPDRLSESRHIDLIVSDGYDWNDMIFGTEYDEAGYYRLDSLQNLKISCLTCMFGGLAAMLLLPGLSGLVASLIDDGLIALVDLFWYRIETFEW